MLRSNKILQKKIDELILMFQKSNIEEIMNILGSKKEVAKRNFIAGIFRGIGIGIGVTIISAIIIYFLQKLVWLNLPGIGKYISDIVKIVETLNNRKFFIFIY